MLYTCTYEEMNFDHLNIPYHMLNESTNKKQHSYCPFKGQCTKDEGIHNWDKSDLEQIINILY